MAIDLESIKGRLAAIEHDGKDDYQPFGGWEWEWYEDPEPKPLEKGANEVFINNAPNDIAALVAEVERLRGLLEASCVKPHEKA